MKTTKPLTSSVVDGLRPKKGQIKWIDYSDGGCRGLALRVSPRGEKVWQFRGIVSGKRRAFKIGGYPEVSLSEARKRSDELRSAAVDGVTGETLETRKIAKTRTVDLTYNIYLDACTSQLSPRTIKEKQRLYNLHIASMLGSKVIGSVSKSDIADVVDTVRRKGFITQSNRVYAEVMAFMNWCADRDFIEAVPKARKLKAKEYPRAQTLTDQELGSLWNSTQNLGQVGGRYLKALILSGQRRDEVRLMKWEELDLNLAVWTIPKERYKTRRDHIVPLSPAFVKLLNEVPNPHAGYVFIGRNPKNPFNGTRGVMTSIRNRLDEAKHYTLHDLRRTFRTWLSRSGIDEVTAERCIGHLPQGIVKVYDLYDRLEERRSAFDAWAEHVIINSKNCRESALRG